MSQQQQNSTSSFTGTRRNESAPPPPGGRPRVRVSQNAGDEKIAKATSVILNPKNLKIYQLIFVVIFILYIWMTEFSSVALIVKSLFVVSLLALMIVETIIIMSYIEE